VIYIHLDRSIKQLEAEGEKLSRVLKARFEPSKETQRRKWKPMEYTENSCLVYMVARMAPEFAAISRVFGELTKWAPQFVPRTLFDFGSGVGSVPW
jgi:ribosomal protein RSM22 (predicted rRNA methylase)